MQEVRGKHRSVQTPDLPVPKFQHLLLSFLKLRCSWDTYTAAREEREGSLTHTTVPKRSCLSVLLLPQSLPQKALFPRGTQTIKTQPYNYESVWRCKMGFRSKLPSED